MRPKLQQRSLPPGFAHRELLPMRQGRALFVEMPFVRHEIDSRYRENLFGDTEPVQKWVVYKLRWPSGWWYIGYTGQPVNKRIKDHRFKGTRFVQERFAAEGNPRVEILGEFQSEQNAVAFETYFLAKEEEGGDWGRSLNVKVT